MIKHILIILLISSTAVLTMMSKYILNLYFYVHNFSKNFIDCWLVHGVQLNPINLRRYFKKATQFEKQILIDSMHRSVDRWVLGHIYNMKNQFWAGLGSRASTVKKKVWGPMMSNFWGPFLCFHGQKINLFFVENIVASPLKSCIE